MVPGIVFRIAWNPRSNPLLVHVVVSVPFMAASDAAFVSPNVALAVLRTCELINVELESLRIRDVFRVKINVIDEVVSVVGERVLIVRKFLCRERTYEVVIPENVRVCARATY